MEVAASSIVYLCTDLTVAIAATDRSSERNQQLYLFTAAALVRMRARERARCINA